MCIDFLFEHLHKYCVFFQNLIQQTYPISWVASPSAMQTRFVPYLEFSVLLIIFTVSLYSAGLAAKTCLTCDRIPIPRELCEGDVCNITSICVPKECTCGNQICNTHVWLIDSTEENSTDVKFNKTIMAGCLHQVRY